MKNILTLLLVLHIVVSKPQDGQDCTLSRHRINGQPTEQQNLAQHSHFAINSGMQTYNAGEDTHRSQLPISTSSNAKESLVLSSSNRTRINTTEINSTLKKIVTIVAGLDYDKLNETIFGDRIGTPLLISLQGTGGTSSKHKKTRSG